MTTEEAIAILEAGRYSESEYLQAKNIAVKALRKQTAVPVDEPASGAGDCKVCPNCERLVSRYEYSHGNVEIPCCKWCGQKLDWSSKALSGSINELEQLTNIERKVRK